MSPTDLVHSSLHEIAVVRPGYLSRGRVDSEPNGTHYLLQAKDVTEDGGVLLGRAARFHPERKPGLYQVSRGDILVVARGQGHRAHHIDQDLPNALAAATFYILRPDREHIIPGYLTWWLNRPRVQAEIDAGSRGTTIGYIGRETLESLNVPIPPLSVQQNIEHLLSLWRKKQSLQLEIDRKREQCIQAVCRNAVRQSKE